MSLAFHTDLPDTQFSSSNHGLAVMHKQISTMYSLASHVSRVADAEWQRACESVRRFSPTVGQLGEWRAHCEGGYSSATIPDDLPDVDDQVGEPETNHENRFDNLDNAGDPNVPADRSVPEYSPRTVTAVTPSGQASAPPQYFSSAGDYGTQNPPASEKTRDPIERERRHQFTTPFAALASFPSPPAHFPIPDVNNLRTEITLNARSESSSSSDPAPFLPISESPVPESISQMPALTEGSSSPVQRNEPLTPSTSTPNSAPQLTVAASRDGGDSTYSQLTNPHSNRSAQEDSESAKPTDNEDIPQDLAQNTDEHDDAEFGVRQNADVAPQPSQPNIDAPSTNAVTRNDTMRSNGSIVAALRDRYTRPVRYPPK